MPRDWEAIDHLITKFEENEPSIELRVEVATKLYELTGERFGWDGEAWRKWRHRQAPKTNATPEVPTIVPEVEKKLRLLQLEKVIDKLRRQGVLLTVDLEKMATQCFVAPNATETDVAQALLAWGRVGWVFELEGPANAVPGGNFLVYDERWIEWAVKKLIVLLAPDLDGTSVVEERFDTKDSLGFEASDLQYTISCGNESIVYDLTLEDSECLNADVTLGRFFDRMNELLHAVGSERRVVCTYLGGDYHRAFVVPSGHMRALATWLPLLPIGVADEKQKEEVFFEARQLLSVEEIVPAERLYIGDIEVADESSLDTNLRELLNFAPGIQLEWETIDNGNGVRFDSGNHLHSQQIRLEGSIDIDSFLKAVNLELDERSEGRRFVEVRNDGWGQELGIAFVDEHELVKLERHGLLPPKPLYSD